MNYDINGIRRLAMPEATKWRRMLAALLDFWRSRGAPRPTDVALYGCLPTLTILGALVSLTVPRVLGPAQFGQYSLVEALFRYGVAFDVGLSLLADRHLPVLRANRTEVEVAAFSSALLWLRLCIAMAAMACAGVALSLLALEHELPFRWQLGAIALAAGVLGMLVNGPTAIERALSHRRRFAILYAGSLGVLSFGRLIGVLSDGVIGCFAVMGTCYAALTVYSYWGMLRRRGCSEAISVRASFSEAVPLFLTLYTYTLLVTANRWVVASQADAASFGHFALGSSVTTLLVGVVGGMTQLWYPRLARFHASGEHDLVSRRVLHDMAALAAGSGLAAMVGICLSPWLIRWIYPQFGSSLVVIRVILASFPATTIAAWLLPLALATGARPWRDGVLLYVSALLFLVAATEAGFHWLGIRGAAWGLIVSMPTLVALQLWRLQSRGVIRWRDALVLLGVVLASTAAPIMVSISVQGVVSQ